MRGGVPECFHCWPILCFCRVGQIQARNNNVVGDGQSLLL